MPIAEGGGEVRSIKKHFLPVCVEELDWPAPSPDPQPHLTLLGSTGMPTESPALVWFFF